MLTDKYIKREGKEGSCLVGLLSQSRNELLLLLLCATRVVESNDVVPLIDLWAFDRQEVTNKRTSPIKQQARKPSPRQCLPVLHIIHYTTTIQINDTHN